VDLAAVHKNLAAINKRIAEAANTHNGFLKELGLPPL